MKTRSLHKLHKFVAFQVFRMNQSGLLSLRNSKLFRGRMTLTIL